MIDLVAGRRTRLAAGCSFVLAAALPLGACGSDTAPPLTGNLVDARGAHAGSFHPADGPPDDQANAAIAAMPANSQEASR